MKFSQSGHSILASRRFSSMHVQPKEDLRPSKYQSTLSEKKKKKTFQEFKIHETLTNSDVSCITNNKH